MPLEWEVRQRLLRLAAMADELASCARDARDDSVRDGVRLQVVGLADEVHGAVAASDPELGDEFRRVVSTGGDELPPEVRAAALVGWLKGMLSAQAVDERREAEAEQRPAPKRKYSLGFRVRSPITREEPPANGGAA